MPKLSRVLPKVLFLAAALFSLAAFFSCENSSDSPSPAILQGAASGQNASNPSPAKAKGGEQCVTFRGSVRTGGALPASYAKALEGLGFGGTEEGVEGISKSARPNVTADGTSIEHFAVATPNSGEPVEGTFASASSTTFEMPLAIGKTWNIVCGIRNVSGDKKIIMSDSFQMEVTVSNSVLSHVFTLTPYTEAVEGVAPSGDVALTVNFDGSAASGGSSISASWEDPALPPLAVEGLAPARIMASGVPVGNHRLAIFFRDSNGVSVYESVQVVTVLNGLTTETWMPESGEAAILSSGHFVVDNDVIKGAASDRIYVGKPAALASNDSVRASDSNSGSAYSPLEHLQAAFNKIQSAGSGSKDFKIFVSGEAGGNAALDAAVIKGVNARSVTIEGLDGLDESLKPKSVLKGSGSGSVFTIASDVPVTIKNLKITGGSGAGQGGGISMASGSDLTLDSGALVTQNSATQQGGGVYNRDGSLKIKKGAAISGNWITSAGASGSDGGAGLFMYGSSAACVMTGGEISDNNKNASYNDKNVRGGGVRLGDSARMTLSGGSVSGNFSKNLGGNFYIDNAFLDISGDAKICQGRVDTSSNTSDDNAWGGALYVEGNSKVTMTGGEISGNTAKAKSSKYACAGVYLLKEFEMTGGVIEGNVVEGGLSSGGAFRVGGLLTIGGSAKIPYGGDAGKNDVYVCYDGGAYKVVQVAASGFSYAASDSAPAAVLAPEGWQRNYAIIKAPSGSDIGAYTPYFKTIDPDFYFGKLSGTVDTAKLKAALCVSNKASAADNDEQSGTKSQPFKTIEFALTKLSAGEPDEIIIDYDSNGDVFGPQEIPDTFTTTNCSALTIRGANGLDAYGMPKDILNASGTRNAGSVLTVKSAVPITIKDLKITGGNCTDAPGDRSGGGIYLTAGELTLADGVFVVGNYAAYGGGVYVKEGASLFMNGTSYIGDKTQTTASGETLGEQCSNSASYGGGIHNSGNVYLGYKKEGSAIKEAGWTGGVCRNYVSMNGGGIYNSKGDVKIRDGNISYNYSYNQRGGGLCASENVPAGKGIELLGGVLEENVAGFGGAVYVKSSFSMKGSPYIPYGGSPDKNDIFLDNQNNTEMTVTIAGDLTLPSGKTTLAAITFWSWKRKERFLSASSKSLITDNKDKFALTSDNDGWQKNYVSDSGHYAELNSPVYVVGTENSGSIRPDDTWGWGNLYNAPNGTKTSPYASVAAALGCAELASATEPNTIIVAGTLKGAQSISGTSVPSDLSLKGYKASGASSKINAGSAGSALTVNKSGLTVTISDLTITGGIGSDLSGGTAKNGGGIYLNAGSVKLSDGAVITGNTVADNGGGVYLAASGCALYMSGKALIGDNPTSTNRASSGTYANQAANGAGIYNNGGSVFIGSNTSGTAASGYSLVNDDTNGHYGVRRNYSTTSGAGAGIYHAGGTLKIASGDVSLNNAGAAGTGTCNGGGVYCAADVAISGGSFKNNYAANGGGLYIAAGKKATVNGAAVFTQNQSWVNGGAVYNAGEFTMSAGTIGGSNSSDANLATGRADLASYGGAIYQGGTFNVSGTAYISSGTLKINDVYLPSNKKVTIDSTWSGSQASNKMTLTPSTWARGSQVLAGTKATDYYTYFNTSDSEWSVGYKESSWTLTDDLKTRIGADIYVAGSENRASGISAPSETASERIGTKLKPFNSIEEGVKACWTTTLPFTVKFSGTITGTAQTIPAGSTSTGGLASAITIEGVQGNTKDIINRNLSTATDSGTALTINTATPVTIKKIKITGGYNKNASGGGIRANVAGASLTLSQGALVTANNLSVNDTIYSGGGVYVEGTSTSPATLIMESDATISGNDSNQGKGGGVGLKYATLCMIGNALIGDKDATSAATGDSGKHSNSAQSGGGVYVGSGSKLRLGYATPGATTGTTLNSAYGIRYNYVYNAGGGVLVASGSSVEIASGSIYANGTIANAAYKNGGGIYLNETATLTMTGGTIAKNKAYDGGGVYLYGTSSSGSSIVMSGGTIGDNSSGVNSAATTTGNAYSNYAANEGGGIYASTKTTVTLNGGNISYNYSGENGGGIYAKTDTTFKANAKYNGAGGSGGGIYSTGTTLTMTAGTIYGNKASATADTDEDRLWCGGGGVWFEGTFKMSGGTIQGNSATWYGGGVGTGDGNFYMSGSAVIGDKSKTAVPDASETTSPTANRAQYGGGFAATNDPDIYLGYSGKTGSTLNASSLASGGICYNYASKHGGGYYQKSGGRPLIMATGNIDYNKAADSASQGGGIYTEAGLQMTGGTITGNAASNGGAILLKKCVYKVAGNIYITYDSASGSANRENTVQMMGTESKITVTGSLTNTNSTVMTVEPHTWAIGTLVADKDTSLSSDNFRTSVAKIGIVKNGIYSKVEPIGGTYNNSSAVSKAVVGIDFSTVTQSNILSYMSGKTWSLSSAEPYPSNELNYFFLCDKTSPNSRYAILKVIHYNSMDCGIFIASSVLIGSPNQESNLTAVDYDTSVSEIRTYAQWNPFKVTSPGAADYITVYKQDHSVSMQLGSNYLGWYKAQ